MDDSNFGMENSSSLVNVKLLLKRILDSYWNKLLCKFCITVHRFHARAQSWTCATYEKCNNGRANSEIGYTTDCLYSFWDRQKADFCMLQLCAFFPPVINFCRSISGFPSLLLSNNSHTMHRFISFMRINHDDDDIGYKCHVKNLMRFFNKNIAREKIDKRFKKFCYFGLLKIVIIQKWNEITKGNLECFLICFI